ASCCQIGYVLDMAEGLVGKFDEENGEGDIRRHVLHIERYRIRGTIITTTSNYRYQACGIGKKILDATGHEWKLKNECWRQGSQHLDRWCQATIMHHFPLPLPMDKP